MEEKNFTFLYPSIIKWLKDTYRLNYGRLVIEPLEKGFGITIGNVLRRVLLSSIPGIAITGIKIEGVPHEFSTIKGVKEDFTHIILNLKQIALKPIISKFPHRFSLTISGKNEIIAGDLINDNSVEVLNPDLYITAIDPSVELKLEIELSEGIGYLPVEKMKFVRKDISKDIILIDGIYSPIKKVSFNVENTRVGQLVDYEKLNFEIWTTGAISPFDAVKVSTEILNNHFQLIGAQQIIGEKPVVKEQIENMQDNDNLDISITELKLSTRVINALSLKNIKTLKDILQTPREQFTEMKNLGKKSLEEVEEILDKWNKKIVLKDKKEK
jgi:DNA-directed RNA polymerase subunit alpha